MFRRLLAVASLLALSAAAVPASAQAPKPWPEAMVNPKPAAGDFTLPMPCGGSMTFRRIDVPADNALDDRRIILGGADPKYAPIENSRGDYIAGGFTDAKKKNQKFYYLGKYEVTQLQYASLSSPCPAVTPEGRLPKVEVTWAEAISFAAQWNAWLVKNAADKLPKEDGAVGFVRLPTEAEWEYAARGGLALSDADFQLPVPPMPGSAAEYVWYQGTESANNQLNGIGLLKPNALGLHDMLGNAGEFVLDPFRLNKLSRMHGQAGGNLVKGGDYRTSLSDIRSAARIEYPPTDAKGERRSPTTGFRLALVPPSLTSTQRLAQVRELWADLPQTMGTALAPQQDDPLKEVDALANATEDQKVKARIQNLATVIKANIQTRNEQRDRSARSDLRAASFLRVMLQSDYKGKIEVRREQLKLPSLSAQLKEQIQQQLAKDEQAFAANVQVYIDNAVRMASEYPEPVTTAQAEILKRELEARQQTTQASAVDVFANQVAQVRAGKRLEPKAVMDGFK